MLKIIVNNTAPLQRGKALIIIRENKLSNAGRG
jgi:hypothetical protein